MNKKKTNEKEFRAILLAHFLNFALKNVDRIDPSIAGLILSVKKILLGNFKRMRDIKMLEMKARALWFEEDKEILIDVRDMDYLIHMISAMIPSNEFKHYFGLDPIKIKEHRLDGTDLGKFIVKKAHIIALTMVDLGDNLKLPYSKINPELNVKGLSWKSEQKKIRI